MLAMAAKILKFNGERPLLMADNEHYTVELLDWISATPPYDLSVPMLKLVWNCNPGKKFDIDNKTCFCYSDVNFLR